MKKIIIAVLLVAAPPLYASELPKLDISPLLERLNVCSVITNHQDILAGGCFKAAEWSWGSANVGVTWDTNDKGATSRGVGGFVAAFGVRSDKAFGWAWRKSALEKRGVKLNFVVPKFEAGPMGGYNNRLGWIWGGFLNGKIPFGK